MSALRLAYATDLPGPAAPPVVAEVAPQELQPAALALFPDYRLDTEGDGRDDVRGPRTDVPAGGKRALEAGRGSGRADRAAKAAKAEKADVVLTRRDREFRIITPGNVHTTHNGPEALARWELALAQALLATAPHLLRLHAGAVRTPWGVLALPGEAGAGKSTLTLALASRGLPVLGDDIVLLDPADGRFLPFKRLLKADSRAVRIAGVAHAPPGPLAELWPDVVLLDPTALGPGWSAPAAAARVLFPRRHRDAGAPRLEPLGSAEALRRLLELVVSDEVPAAREFQILADALSDAELAELHYARTEEAADFLVEG